MATMGNHHIKYFDDDGGTILIEQKDEHGYTCVTMPLDVARAFAHYIIGATDKKVVVREIPPPKRRNTRGNSKVSL